MFTIIIFILLYFINYSTIKNYNLELIKQINIFEE